MPYSFRLNAALDEKVEADAKRLNVSVHAVTQGIVEAHYKNNTAEARQKNMDLLLTEIAGLKGEVGELRYEVMRTRAMVSRYIVPEGGEKAERLMEVAGKDVETYLKNGKGEANGNAHA